MSSRDATGPCLHYSCGDLCIPHSRFHACQHSALTISRGNGWRWVLFASARKQSIRCTTSWWLVRRGARAVMLFGNIVDATTHS